MQMYLNVEKLNVRKKTKFMSVLLLFIKSFNQFIDNFLFCVSFCNCAYAEIIVYNRIFWWCHLFTFSIPNSYYLTYYYNVVRVLWDVRIIVRIMLQMYATRAYFVYYTKKLCAALNSICFFLLYLFD